MSEMNILPQKRIEVTTHTHTHKAFSIYQESSMSVYRYILNKSVNLQWYRCSRTQIRILSRERWKCLQAFHIYETGQMAAVPVHAFSSSSAPQC